MKHKNNTWPHAPPHHLSEKGTYMVTCGTYRKQHLLNTPAKLTLFRNRLFELASQYGWQLQAWAILSNHYHLVAASPDNPDSLKRMISALHTLTARDINRLDGSPKRRVWYNYYDSHITYETSWIARLKYVHQNPVHHGVVLQAELYEWCSAAWFAREGGSAFVKTVNSFKTDRVNVYDDYGLRAQQDNHLECGKGLECDGSTSLSNTREKPMECDGSTPLSNIKRDQARALQNTRTLAHVQEPAAQYNTSSPPFKSAVKSAHSTSTFGISRVMQPPPPAPQPHLPHHPSLSRRETRNKNMECGGLRRF